MLGIYHTRKIDGKTYYHIKTVDSKRRANQFAKDRRGKLGCSVRVIKTKEGYEIWSRH